MNLQSFAEQAFTALGAVVEPPAPETLDVLLPQTWIDHFGGREFLPLRFGDEGASRLPMSIGSTLLEQLIRALSDRGLLAKAYLNPLHCQLADPEEKLSRKFHFANARPFCQGEVLEEGAHGLFTFKVSYLTDDQQERLYRLAIDLASGLENKTLLAQWDRLFLDAEPTYPEVPRFQGPEWSVVYERSLGVLQNVIKEDLQKIRATQEKFLSRDLQRIEDYYKDLLAEESRKGEQHREAIERDHQKKALDAREKYRLTVNRTLVNGLIVYEPRVRTLVRLRTRDGEIERSFFWDPALKEFLDAPCDRCHNASRSFQVEDNRLLCTDCGG